MYTKFFSFVEDGLIDFIVLGQIPGTNIQLGFRGALLLALATTLLFFIFVEIKYHLSDRNSNRLREFFGLISL